MLAIPVAWIVLSDIYRGRSSSAARDQRIDAQLDLLEDRIRRLEDKHGHEPDLESETDSQ
jgi:hypothetical protein